MWVLWWLVWDLWLWLGFSRHGFDQEIMERRFECLPSSYGVYSKFRGTFLVGLDWGTIEVSLDLEDELKGKEEDSADSITIYKTEERSLWRHKREVDFLLRRIFAIIFMESWGKLSWQKLLQGLCVFAVAVSI